MPALLDLLVLALLGGASYLFLSARETAQDTRRALEQLRATSEHLQSLEVRLRHVERLLYEQGAIPLPDEPPRALTAANDSLPHPAERQREGVQNA